MQRRSIIAVWQGPRYTSVTDPKALEKNQFFKYETFFIRNVNLAELVINVSGVRSTWNMELEVSSSYLSMLIFPNAANLKSYIAEILNSVIVVA